ncbi:hypothetical protein MKZ15_01250 [Paenibacillus sp. FSL R7-0216]|uniref:hypothetical protein n=1 Tax=Paenibacillus sp. FSL R7-0216 TaxID=2921677 RepID=UPI0030D97882
MPSDNSYLFINAGLRPDLLRDLRVQPISVEEAINVAVTKINDLDIKSDGSEGSEGSEGKESKEGSDGSEGKEGSDGNETCDMPNLAEVTNRVTVIKYGEINNVRDILKPIL